MKTLTPREELCSLANRFLLAGWTLDQALNASHLLWLYHRELARSVGITTSKSGWFNQLTEKNEDINDVRGAFDIIKDYLSVSVNSLKKATQSQLCDHLKVIMIKFASSLCDKYGDLDTLDICPICGARDVDMKALGGSKMCTACYNKEMKHIMK